MPKDPKFPKFPTPASSRPKIKLHENDPAPDVKTRKIMEMSEEDRSYYLNALGDLIKTIMVPDADFVLTLVCREAKQAFWVSGTPADPDIQRQVAQAMYAAADELPGG